jgi:hypothetical protein
VGYLKVQKIYIYNWPWSLHKMIVMDIFYGNNQCIAQWLLEPGAQASLASAQQAGQCLFNMSLRMSSSVTSPSLSTCQFFNTLEAMRTNSTLSITSYLIKRTLRNLATLKQLLRTLRRRIQLRWLPGWRGTTCLTTWEPGASSSRSS